MHSICVHTYLIEMKNTKWKDLMQRHKQTKKQNIDGIW